MNATAIDLVESLDTDTQAELTKEYEAHVKVCVARGDAPMRPDEFVQSKRPDLQARADKNAAEQAGRENEIRRQFRDLMHANGYGSIQDKALLKLRTGIDALSGVCTLTCERGGSN